MYKGSGKYLWKNIFFNGGAMYITGATIITLAQIIPLFIWYSFTADPFSRAVLEEFVGRGLDIFIPNPNLFLLNVPLNIVVGALISTIKWNIGIQRSGGF